MKGLLLLFLCPALACAHVTEVEWSIIEKMRLAAEEQQGLLEAATKEAAEARDIALTSIAGLKGVAGLAEQMKAAMVEFDKQAQILALAAQANQERADQAQTLIARKDVRILQLWITTSILGIACLGLAYLLFKP